MAREPFIRSIILLALSLYLGHVLVTGKITAYIHPRFVGFTWFAVAGFALIGLGMLAGALRMRDRPLRPALYLSVLLPVLLGVAIPPSTFGAELVARQGINLLPRQRSRVAIAAQPPAANPTPAPQPESKEQDQKPPAPGAPEAAGAPPAGHGAPSTITAAPAPAPPPTSESTAAGSQIASVVLTEQNMFHLLNEIYEAPDRYLGAVAEMTGFVYKLEDLDSDEFALVRLIVTCHVAHAVPDGFITVYPEAAELAVDAWYQVRGVFEPGFYQGKETIKLRVTELTSLAQPKDPYIYP